MTYDHDNIPVFTRSYTLYKTLTKERVNIPKIDRYHLWQKVEGNCLTLIELIIESQHTIDSEKLRLIRRMSQTLDMERIYIRLAHDTEIISKSRYLSLSSEIDTIGRMLGGWMRAKNRKDTP